MHFTRLLIASLCVLRGGMGYAETYSPTFEEIQRIINQHGIRSIEDLLPHLPVEYRSRYTLMRSSRGIQGASPLYPRVILYGRDASLVMTFNGDASQAGFRTLELIQFRQNENRFELREIRFPEKIHQKVEVSEPNPPRCLGCHQHPPRPNWDTYPFWSGAYAGNDDTFEYFPASTEETRNLYEFLKTVPSHPRYRHLEHVALHYQQRAEVSAPHYNGLLRLLALPNISLGGLLQRHNLMRIAGELLSAPRYSELKWLVSLILADCATLNEMDAHTYLSKYIKAEEFLKDKDFFRPVFQNPIEKDLPIPFDYLLLLNEKLGWDLPYPVANWSMAFDLTDTKPEPGEPASHFKFQHGPFQTAGIGLGDLFSLGISMLDPEVQKIYRTIERADGYGLGTQYELLIGLPSIYLPGPFSDRSAELAACKQVETEVAK